MVVRAMDICMCSPPRSCSELLQASELGSGFVLSGSFKGFFGFSMAALMVGIFFGVSYSSTVLPEKWVTTWSPMGLV